MHVKKIFVFTGRFRKWRRCSRVSELFSYS